MYIKVLERDKPTVPPKQYADRFVNHFRTSFEASALPLAVRLPPPEADKPDASYPLLPPPSRRRAIAEELKTEDLGLPIG